MTGSAGSGRLVALVRLVVVVTCEAAAVWALTVVGGSVGAVRWERLSGWLAETPPEQAVGSAARLVGLVLAWWLLASTVLYLAASVTRLGRLARGLRFATLPGIRSLVDASVALAITTSAIGGSALAAGAAPRPVAVTALAAAPPGGGVSLGTPPGPAPVVPAATPPPAVPVAAAGFSTDVPGAVSWHKVVRGDSLWEIAEDHLGSGKRYPEIWDLNARRTMNDGRRFRNPSRIRPGWVLALPAAASAEPAAPAAAPALATPQAAAAPAAPEEADAPEAAAAVPAAPTTTVAPGVTAAAPVAPSTTAPPEVSPPSSLGPAVPSATPSTVAALPGGGAVIGGAAPAAPGPGPTTTTPPGVPAAVNGAGTVMTNRASGRRSSLPTPFLGVGGVLVAAGVGAELVRRRRRQLARRRRHERLVELSEPAVAAARAVGYADVDDVAWLGAELRLLVRSLTGTARARFEATVVQYRAQESIEVALARSCGTPPAGWSGAAGSRVWTLEAAHGREELATVEDLPPCLPLLVSLGDQDGHGQVLLNLEASSAVGVVGDPPLVDALVRSMLWELALSPLAEHLTLVTLGIDRTDAKEMVRWRPAIDAGDVAATLRSRASFFATALAAGRAPTLIAARADGEEAWGPTVAVVTAATLTPEILEAANGPGVVVVVVGHCPADGLVVHVADGEVAVPSIGLVCVAQQLSREAADALSGLLTESATDPVPAEPDEELNLIIPSPIPADLRPPAQGVDEETPTANGRPAVTPLRPSPEPFTPPEPRVLVRLLGPPSAEGTVASVTAQQLAGLAYLATHPNPTTGEMKHALWAGGEVKSQRWRDFLKDLRLTVPEGVIGTVTDDVVPISGLGSDLDLLEAFLARAASHPEDRVACLQSAVELLRGVPFVVSDPKAARSWRWLDVEFANGRLCVQLTQGARELAEFYLESGDPAAACTVAAKVLRMASLDEGLTNVLMRAYAALGSPEEAERVYRRHEADLDELLGEGADDSTRHVMEQIAAHAAAAKGQGRPLTLLRSPR